MGRPIVSGAVCPVCQSRELVALVPLPGGPGPLLHAPLLFSWRLCLKCGQEIYVLQPPTGRAA